MLHCGCGNVIDTWKLHCLHWRRTSFLQGDSFWSPAVNPTWILPCRKYFVMGHEYFVPRNKRRKSKGSQSSFFDGVEQKRNKKTYVPPKKLPLCFFPLSISLYLYLSYPIFALTCVTFTFSSLLSLFPPSLYLSLSLSCPIFALTCVTFTFSSLLSLFPPSLYLSLSLSCPIFALTCVTFTFSSLLSLFPPSLYLSLSLSCPIFALTCVTLTASTVVKSTSSSPIIGGALFEENISGRKLWLETFDRFRSTKKLTKLPEKQRE
jgi:hypothetical protein